MDVEMLKRFKLKKTHRGAALIEYVLIASLLSLALIGGYRAVGSGYKRIYNNISESLP
ncbi:MAG: Flp family type IVb pilin [Alphaproteobacteria bacterium]|nr:Flp family type IVb pilin [Alphaproteobacteria bacterium]